MSLLTSCPECGTQLAEESWTEGLCPGCLLALALEESSVEEVAEMDPEAMTLAFRQETLTKSQIVGNRYRARSLLGRGGMGEVWRAFDLKLRVDVALKALRTELVENTQALEALRQEVRVAREVVSPNVCRVFDLQELDGQELISMEYIDGRTLVEILRERGPLELDEAREIAAQFLAGLEAIHDAGLVHRDIKPENLMVTRAGRVVVMDFGIAKGLGEDRPGAVAGTPAYMAPEVIRGHALDARTDVFSAGVVLAEMVDPGGIRNREDRQRLWQGIHGDPPALAETPWAAVVGKAVAGDPGQRYASASGLSRALEEVTLRAAGDEAARPYPGLAAFQEEDAGYFYGRELEVEAMWRKLRRPHLLALIGPSGAGKSSFLRAGLLPIIPEGWRAVICTPGTRPFTAVAQALLPEFAGDADAPSSLLLFEEADVAVGLVARWRQQHKHALVIIDQFEELFTQNPLEVQARFTELLGRLALEADVQVLLSMRDDFLFHCAPQESLAPIFSELTPLKSLSGAALRRALVQPALKCGYKFENESLIDEMVAEVEGERGALPMLAFAAARLWDHRDREQGLLTDEAYERIGGVGGALAQHAEATLEKIGRDQAPIVRELFRNLVTAQGTRAARTRDELLSVFDRGHDPRVEGHDPESRGDSGRVPARDRVPESPERPAPISGEREDAARVLNTLIDARLLTSYEEPASEDEEQPHHRIEIIHESLLTNWPRLVRWRTQDQEGAQLRDELRQAAQKWDQRDRSEDLLWTGTSFREFELWRDRYPGGLTGLEEEYGHAMTSKALRRKRRRRLAVAAMLVIAATVTAVTGTLWRQSERSEQLARDEALRAEASKLLALAQLRHGEDPTEALAYTTASLELADTKEARIFAMRVLWEGPPALELRPEESEDLSIRYPRFSPDGNRLAVAGHDEWVRVWTAEGAEPPVVLPGHLLSNRGSNAARWVSNELLATGLCCGNAPRSDVWRFPGGEKVRTIDFGGPSYWQVGGNHLRAEVVETDAASGHEVYRLRSWGLPDGDPRELGRVDWSALGASESTLLPNGKDWLYAKGESVYLRPLPAGSGKDDRLLGRHPTEVEGIYPLQVDPAQVYSRDRAGEIRIWDFSKEEPKLAKVISQPEGEPEWRFPDPSLRWADAWLGPEGNRQARVWDLDAWPQARPLTLRRSGSWIGALHAFHPRGDWLVVSTQALAGLTFWPLLGEWPRIVDGYSGLNRHLVFSPDGHWLATLWADGTLRLWPLPGSGSLGIRTLTLPGEAWNMRLVFDPHGRFLFLVGGGGRANVVPLDGSPSRKLGASDDDVFFIGAAVSPSGRLVATAYGGGPGEPTLRVWDLETGELRLFDLPEGSIDDDWAVVDVAFADETTLYTAGVGGVHRWILPSGAHELVLGTKPGYMMAMMFGPDERTALVHESVIGGGRAGGSISIVDLVTGVAQALPEYGDQNRHTFALDTSGRVAIAGDREGIVRVGRVAGGEPHLLVGHEGPVDFVAISPDGRWIGSTGEDNTLRLWPMPDLDKPPFHTLPRHEFIAKLKSLTNIRVVRDPESAEGWRVELDPFPGWKTVPRW